MPTFIASYTNSRGRPASIKVEAEDPIQAKRKLLEFHFVVTPSDKPVRMHAPLWL
jgi:hypothetical protein